MPGLKIIFHVRDDMKSKGLKLCSKIPVFFQWFFFQSKFELQISFPSCPSLSANSTLHLWFSTFSVKWQLVSSFWRQAEGQCHYPWSSF